MSLEATIQENTNAIRELIAAFQAGVPTTAAQVAAVATEAGGKSEGKTKPEKEAAAKKTTAAATATAAATPPTAEAGSAAAPEKKAEPSEASDKAPTYQATADAVTKLAREKGRDTAIAVLTKFGAAKLPDVKPEQFAAVIAACEEAGA